MEDPLKMLDTRRGSQIVVSFTDGHPSLTGLLASADEHCNLLIRNVVALAPSGDINGDAIPLRLVRGEKVKRIDFV